jgi:hypothetical protein
MKFRLVIAAFTLVNLSFATAATVPVYINTGKVQSPPDTVPQIDATTFINDGYFEVSFLGAGSLPYQTANTIHFRNELGRQMFGHPGYNFEHVFGNIRQPMTTWQNRGSISSFINPTNFTVFAGTIDNWLLVSSQSITNSGLLHCTDQGVVRLSGATINMARGRLRAGEPVSPFPSGFGGSYLFETNYFNEVGITDLYWGAGSNNVLSGAGSPMRLDSPATPNFSVTNLGSALHSIAFQGGSSFVTNLNVIPFSFSPFFNGVNTSAYLTTNGNQIFVQAVFVVTNLFDINLTNDIKFFPTGFGGPAIVQVGFHTSDRDVALDTNVMQSLYVIDGLGTATNVTLARNQQLNVNTRKPDTYTVSKAPYRFFGFGLPGFASYTNPIPLYSSTSATNIVPVTYAAYSAQLAGPNLAVTDPTTLRGRVEIIGQDVNMRDARVRAESTFILTANNLVSNSQARASAPFMSFDVGTTQPQLVVSNLAPSSVNRLYGTVSAWSAVWDNTDVNIPNMNIRFHVLIVDHSLQTTVPVAVTKFHGRGPQIVLNDFLRVSQTLRLESGSVHVKSNAGLAFPPNWSWGKSNMVNIVNYTNEGTVTVPGIAVLGTDKGIAYANVINRGIQTAQSQSILANNFENSGSLVASGGNITVNGQNLALRGSPLSRELVVTTNIVFLPPLVTNYVTNLTFVGGASITARGNIELIGNTITLSNALLQAGDSTPGAIILNASTRLTDSGPQRTNYWLASGGIQVPRLPTQASDLMGTYVQVRVPSLTEVQNIWDGKNLGATVMGYSNNLALGKLTLDAGEESVIRFSGLPGKDNAIYVDYLELLNNATNLTTLVFDSNIKIYFAHANIAPKKLDDGTPTSRLRWVRSFMGPLSTTNIVYPSGNVYPVNISLAQHVDLDSDGDGTPNYKDRTPIYTTESVGLQIARDVQANQVLLSWRALQGSTTHIEFKPALTTAPWQLLRSTTAPASMRLNATDITTGRTQRIYRVRVDLPPQ